MYQMISIFHLPPMMDCNVVMGTHALVMLRENLLSATGIPSFLQNYTPLPEK